MNVVWCGAAGDSSVLPMRRTLIAVPSLLLAGLLLAGCSAGGYAADESGGGMPAQAPLIAEGDSAGGDGGAMAEEERSVIVTGTMTVTAADPSDAARQAVRIVEAAGGRVDARSEYAPANGDQGSANLTLRIPAEKLQSVLDDLAALGVDGSADEISTYTQDVTVAVADLESRIATQRGIIDRLNALFERATTIDDLIQLETQIAQHQAELESLEAQQRQTADQVAMSTIDLYLRSEASAPATQPGDFLSGLQAGWGAFVAFFSGLLVALGVLLPWILTAGLITAAVILIVRWSRARKARAAA